MIYTLTLNPSIDYHIRLLDFTEGTINQVQNEWKVEGGKGINVSKVLKNLGMESMVLGFVGGFTGDFIRGQINQQGIAHQLIQIAEDSRINMKLKSSVETEITGVSPRISESALYQLFEQLEKLTDEDFLVLAGSVPDCLPADIYQRIIQHLQTRRVRIFLDAKGQALRNSLSQHPFLIKPNHHELGELFGVKITSPQDAIVYGRKAIQLGAENVIVSMAGEGAVFVNSQQAFLAQIPLSEPVNSIGAGDSMVAGFLFYYVKTGKVAKAFHYAVAAGSTTALSQGFCTPEKIQQFLSRIIITEMTEKGC